MGARFPRPLALAVAACVIMTALPVSEAAGQDGGDSVLTIARPSDVRALNPLRQANNYTSEVTSQIHEGLVTISPDQEIAPVLATDWELLDDGLTYRVTLRDDVTFHSGEPFNAEAIAWNMDMQLNGDPPGIAAGLIPPMSAITVVDEYTIDFTLEQPSGVFMAILGAPLFMIIDPSVHEQLGDDGYDDGPSGTGPFMYDSWTPGVNVELVANENYWNADNGPEVDRVVFEVVPEASARANALLNGNIDMAFSVAAEEIDAFNADGFQVFQAPSTRVVFIGLNTADPILEDADVRRALAHAINLDQVQTIIGANGSIAQGIGVESALGFFPSVRDYDPDESMRLLDEAGWVAGSDGIREKDGVPLEINVLTQATIPGEMEAMQVIQQQWRAVGARMVIDHLADGGLHAGLAAEAGAHEDDPNQIPRYQGFVVASGIRTGEVGYIMARPKCDQGARGLERYCNPDYDEAFALSQSTAPVEERLVGYERMAQIFEEDVIRLPVFVMQINTAASDDVEGFVLNPNHTLNLRGVSVND